MKPRRLVTATLAAAFALAATGLSTAPAQTAPAPAAPAPAPLGPPPRGGGPGGRGGGMGRRAMENLTPEEQTRVQNARRATARDPAVVEARRALMKAEHDAMLKQDPTLGPVLEKLRPGGGDGPGAGLGGQGKNRNLALAAPARDDGQGLAMLTPEERTRLSNAQRAARQDPSVVAARQTMQSATSPEARRAARQTMQEALRAAMLRTDAGIGPILEKVGRGAQGRPGRA